MPSTTRATAGTVSQGILLLVVRLVFAAILIGRAVWRWQFEGMQAQIAQLERFDVLQPELLAWGTVLLEAVGGVLLAIGFFTRVVAALVLAENIAIIALIKWESGPFLADFGWEYNAALAALALVFVAFGAGRTGLDSLVFGRGRRRRRAEEAGSADLYQPKLGTTQP